MELLYFLLLLGFAYCCCQKAFNIIILLCLISIVLHFIYGGNAPTFMVPNDDSYLTPIMRNVPLGTSCDYGTPNMTPASSTLGNNVPPPWEPYQGQY